MVAGVPAIVKNVLINERKTFKEQSHMWNLFGVQLNDFYHRIQFVVTVIMARFLLPSDYGMVGMLAIVLQLSQTLMDSGFTNALIRYKERTEIDYSTVFFFNILASLVIYFLIFSSSLYIVVL